MSKVQIEILDDHQAQLTVKVEDKRVQEAYQVAAQRIGKRIRIPGFRPGKAPYHVIVSQVGLEALQDEVLDTLGQEVYVEALRESGLKPYAPGSLMDYTLDPMVLTFVVPLQPDVDLGDYRALRISFEVPDLADEFVEKAINTLRERTAILEPVDRPAEVGDLVIVDIVGNVEGTADVLSLDQEAVSFVVGEAADEQLPGLAQQLVGLTVGEMRSFDLPIPDDEGVDEEIRGKIAHIEVTCQQVHRRELLELNDEFARSVSDFDTLEDLRGDVRKTLQATLEEAVASQYADRALEALLEGATVRFPPVMVEEEIDELIDDFEKDLKEQRLTLREYLRINNLTMEDMRGDLRSLAEDRLRTVLILARFTEQEGLTVSDEEVEDEIKTLSLSFSTEAEVAQRVLAGREGKRIVRNRLILDKIKARLTAITKGEEIPEPTSPTALEELETTDTD